MNNELRKLFPTQADWEGFIAWFYENKPGTSLSSAANRYYTNAMSIEIKNRTTK